MATIKGHNMLLFLVIVVFYCGFVSANKDCTLPWNGRVHSQQEFLQFDEIKQVAYVFKNICPTPIGKVERLIVNFFGKKLENFSGVGFKAQEGDYCCYNLSGEVECCDLPHFVLFILICLVPFLTILIMCCCCCRQKRVIFLQPHN